MNDTNHRPRGGEGYQNRYHNDLRTTKPLSSIYNNRPTMNAEIKTKDGLKISYLSYVDVMSPSEK